MNDEYEWRVVDKNGHQAQISPPMSERGAQGFADYMNDRTPTLEWFAQRRVVGPWEKVEEDKP